MMFADADSALDQSSAFQAGINRFRSPVFLVNLFIINDVLQYHLVIPNYSISNYSIARIFFSKDPGYPGDSNSKTYIINTVGAA